MRLVFLNVWYGAQGQLFKDFINQLVPTTDIFCFQEAPRQLSLQLKDLFATHDPVFDCKFLTETDEFFQTTYVKNNLDIQSCKTLLTDTPNTGLCLYTRIGDGKNLIDVCNVHGISQPGDKLDNPGRLLQSQTIIDFLKNKGGPKIIGGDFNLEFDTQSVSLFEKNGYRNLIKEYKIATTRNRLSWELYPDNKQYFADYVFVSPDVNVINFSVPQIEISDHLPLILEIEQ